MTIRDDEFPSAVRESIDEVIKSLFSQEGLNGLLANLKNRRSIEPQDIPSHLTVFSIVLEEYFGRTARIVEKSIVRSLYSRYGLEYHAHEGLELVDYVEEARRKLRSAPARDEPSKVNLPLKGDFDRLLIESVREGIEDALGKDSAQLAIRFMERDVTFDQLPRHLPTFYAALNKNFGNDHARIELSIARKLYENLSMEFIETPNTQLSRYVEQAYIKLSQREQLGFVSTNLEGHSKTAKATT